MNPLLILGLGVGLLWLYSGSAYAATKQIIEVQAGETWAISMKFTGIPIDPSRLDLMKSEYGQRGIEVQSATIDTATNTLNTILTFNVPDQIALGHFVEMMPGKGWTVTSAKRVSMLTASD